MATIARRTNTRPLNIAPSQALAEQLVTHSGTEKSFADYVAQDPLVDGVVVLHDGKVVFEAYPNMHPWQRHFAWSVTKVVTATALAALVERGQVDMDAPVDRYVPVLKDSAWAGIGGIAGHHGAHGTYAGFCRAPAGDAGAQGGGHEKRIRVG